MLILDFIFAYDLNPNASNTQCSDSTFESGVYGSTKTAYTILDPIVLLSKNSSLIYLIIFIILFLAIIIVKEMRFKGTRPQVGESHIKPEEFQSYVNAMTTSETTPLQQNKSKSLVTIW